MGNAIHKILEEDQSLRFYRDPQTKEFLLAGSGQQHVEIIVSRLKKRYGVDVELHAPKIPYRETIRGKADVQGRHKKQTGGHGQFGDCWIRMEPLPRGGKFEFANEVFGGAIPRNFIPAIEKGIVETAEKGYLAGYPGGRFQGDGLRRLLSRCRFLGNVVQAGGPQSVQGGHGAGQAGAARAGDERGSAGAGRIRGRPDGRYERPPRAHLRHGYQRRDADHQGAGADVGNAQLSERPDLHDAGPRDVLTWSSITTISFRGPQAEKIVAAAKAAKTGEEEEEE